MSYTIGYASGLHIQTSRVVGTRIRIAGFVRADSASVAIALRIRNTLLAPIMALDPGDIVPLTDDGNHSNAMLRDGFYRVISASAQPRSPTLNPGRDGVFEIELEWVGLSVQVEEMWLGSDPRPNLQPATPAALLVPAYPESSSAGDWNLEKQGAMTGEFGNINTNVTTPTTDAVISRWVVEAATYLNQGCRIERGDPTAVWQPVWGTRFHEIPGHSSIEDFRLTNGITQVTFDATTTRSAVVLHVWLSDQTPPRWTTDAHKFELWLDSDAYVGDGTDSIFKFDIGIPPWIIRNDPGGVAIACLLDSLGGDVPEVSLLTVSLLRGQAAATLTIESVGSSATPIEPSALYLRYAGDRPAYDASTTIATAILNYGSCIKDNADDADDYEWHMYCANVDTTTPNTLGLIQHDSLTPPALYRSLVYGVAVCDATESVDDPLNPLTSVGAWFAGLSNTHRIVAAT